ncbi:MAG: hypothetical protein Q7R95_04065 [bacterium]|nr:hypothetical protein [bacterium]
MQIEPTANNDSKPQKLNYTPLPKINHSIINFFFDIITKKRKVRIFLIALIIGFILSVQPAYNLYTFGKPFLKNIDKRVIIAINEVFPEKLEIKIINGTATSNVQEPFYLTISQSTFTNIFSYSTTQPENNVNKPQSKMRLLTINTQGKAEDFEQFQTLVMLTARNLIYYNDGEIKIQSLSSIPNMTITKALILSKINEINSKNKLLTILNLLLYISPLVFTLFNCYIFLQGVFTISVVAFIIAKILNLKIPFGNLFRLTGVFYAVSTMILSIISWIPFMVIFHSWISTFFTVVINSLLYLILSSYKKFSVQVNE